MPCSSHWRAGRPHPRGFSDEPQVVNIKKGFIQPPSDNRKNRFLGGNFANRCLIKDKLVKMSAM